MAEEVHEIQTGPTTGKGLAAVAGGVRPGTGARAATLSNTSRVVLSKLSMWVRRYGLVLLVYLGTTSMTGAFFMGDTLGYANAILASQLGEFGHLLWYPLGWVVSHLLVPASRLTVAADARTSTITTLVTLSWLAGLLSVFMLYGVVEKICQRTWVANVAAVGLIFSQGFLNWVHSGSSYIPGLSLLLLGIYLLVTGGEMPAQSLGRQWAAGVALACAVGLWFPYFFSIPAALAFPLLAFEPDKTRWRFVRQSAVAFASVTVLMYGSAGVLQGIHSVAGLRQWIGSSGHGITGSGGVPRMVFGLARSFTNVGTDGVMFKRFLVHDPLNPAALSDLVRLSLGTLVLFYLLLGSITIILMQSEKGRRVWGLLALNCIPLLAFAVFWESGAFERYLPLYPSFFVSLAYCLSTARVPPFFKIVVVSFMTTALVSNLAVTASPVLAHRQNQVVMRMRDLVPLLKPQSLVITVNQQDEVFQFYWTFRFHPINRAGLLSVQDLIEPGTGQVLQWHQRFASSAFSVWAAGGDEWVSKRVLSSRPRPQWEWVESSDPRISWMDIYAFFSRLELGRSVGGADGFVLVLPSPKNKETLSRWLVHATVSPRGPRLTLAVFSAAAWGKPGQPSLPWDEKEEEDHGALRPQPGA